MSRDWPRSWPGGDEADPRDFAPALLRLQERAPSPLGRRVLWALAVFLAVMLAWAWLGRLDIVAVAEGKLVPASYLKIVQPAEQGIVREILVREGEPVRQGQPLIRMDAALTGADARAIRAEFDNRRLALRRIDAQLAPRPLAGEAGDPQELFSRVAAQYAANLQAHETALGQERSVLEKARHDLSAARETKSKLEKTLPHFLEQEQAFGRLAQGGFAGRILATDKTRERIEKEQDLRTQDFVIQANLAVIEQSQKKLAQIGADYRRQLQTERVEAAHQLEKSRQELAKIAHRHELLELKSPADGFVKDLATHTAGTVAAPGTILMTLVPREGRMVAEIWVGNHDVGFIRPGQPVKLKLAPFQFQKYGMLEGKVKLLSADATEAPSANTRSDALSGRDRPMGPLAYRALVDLDTDALAFEGKRLLVSPGMQVSAEIHLGTRSVMEYLLSPLQKAFHEAARER